MSSEQPKSEKQLTEKLVVPHERASKLEQLDVKYKKTKTALQEIENSNKQIFESSKDCIKILDLEGRLLFMNRGGQKLLEIEDVTPYLNRSWLDYWKGQDNKAACKAVSKAVQGSTGAFRGYCPTAKGTPKWWDIINDPLKIRSRGCSPSDIRKIHLGPYDGEGTCKSIHLLIQ